MKKTSKAKSKSLESKLGLNGRVALQAITENLILQEMVVKLQLENERLNSEAIEQAGLAQDAEFAMQEAEKDAQELKNQLAAWKNEALRLESLWKSAVDSRSVAFDYVSDLKTTVRTLAKFVN